MRGRRSLRRAFTLIELLVVIAIIAILVAMLLPAVQQVREAARKSQCQDHLHNLGIALHNYESSFKVYPYAVSHSGAIYAGTAGNRPRILNHKGWMLVLPFMEQKPLYDLWDSDLPSGSHKNGSHTGTLAGPAPGAAGNANDKVVSQTVDLFMCPSDSGPTHFFTTTDANYSIAPGSTNEFGAFTNYDFSTRRISSTAAVWLQDAIDTRPLFGADACAEVRDITDGTSNVAMVVETLRDVWDGRGQAWGYVKHVGHGIDLGYVDATGQIGINFTKCCGWDSPPFQRATPRAGRLGTWSTAGSLHPGGCQICLGDAKVTFISENVDVNVRQRLSRISDGNPVSF
jgi:prepilin-type N-terminal cleavage/methylation domain-containing protein